jgi:hypothetical protein
VRTCAFELHMDMTQKASCADIWRQHAGR